MARVGQARRRDTTEAAIVAALESIGATVYRLNDPGFADLIVERRGYWLPIEVKRKGGKLTPAQRVTQLITPYPIIETPEQALALFGIHQ